MPVWLLLLAAAGLFAVARRPGGTSDSGYRQTVNLGGPPAPPAAAGGPVAPVAAAGGQAASSGGVPHWRTGSDGKQYNVWALPDGATYYYPCLPGDLLFQDVWCARGGFVNYGVARSGSVGDRSFGLLWSVGGELSKRAATIGQTFTENAEPLAAAAALIATNAAKAVKLAKKYAPTGQALLDKLLTITLSDEAAEDLALADL